MPQVEEPPKDHVAPSDAARDALHKLAELRAYAQQYFSAKADKLKLTARNIAIMAALGIVGLIAAGATLVIALVMLLSGIAGAIAALAHGRMWVCRSLPRGCERNKTHRWRFARSATQSHFVPRFGAVEPHYGQADSRHR